MTVAVVAAAAVPAALQADATAAPLIAPPIVPLIAPLIASPIAPPIVPLIAPLVVAAQSLVCAAGVGVAAFAALLRDNRSALTPNTVTRTPLPTWVGEVPRLLQQGVLPAALAPWDCRATRLAWLGLQADGFAAAAHAACHRFGAARVGLVLGTSASTIGVSEAAYRTLDAEGRFPLALRSESLNSMHAVTAFVQRALGVLGPAVTVSTACSSSAKAFAQAARWLQLSLVDAVVVGGVDALCDSVLFGFHALQLVSPAPCEPFGAQRRGISVGEAAGFALLQRAEDGSDGAETAAVHLLGYGEANDAHHMSSPHPQGLGAERALRAALLRAGVAAHDITHVSLHGTATALNDSVEAALVARVYAPNVHASATKGCTGHTMGAAGMLGVVAASLALQTGLETGLQKGLPASLQGGTPGTQQVDETLPVLFRQQLRLQPALHSAPQRACIAAVHAFGFGGNNAVLIFGQGHR